MLPLKNSASKFNVSSKILQVFKTEHEKTVFVNVNIFLSDPPLINPPPPA